MFDLDSELDPETRERLEELETRVARLERALAQGMGAIAAKPSDCAITQKLVALRNEAELLRTRPLKILQAPPPPAPTPAERADTLDRLGITGAFASLDNAVAAAAEAETNLGRKNFSFAPVAIDEGLLDAPKAAPRAPPVKIDVVSHLEERHPKILAKIMMIWRTPELAQFLRRLIVDDRGDRAGFDPGVMTELLMLSDILETAAETDRWNANSRAF